MRRKDSVSRTTGFVVGLAWRVILIAAVVYALLQGVRIAYSFGHGLLYEHALAGDDAAEQEIVISDGEDLDTLADDLMDAGLIDNRTAFILQAHLYELEIQPGSYALSPSMTVAEIIEQLQQEGAKNQELTDKNLVASGGETAAAVEETADDGIEVIGGTEDENEILQDNADAMTTEREEGNP